MLLKYLSYSLVTVNRQPSTMRNLSFALFFNFVRKNLIQKENFKKNSKKLLLTILFSTVLLAVSCANSAPFEVGGGLDSIPTASGTKVTFELLDYKGTYTGTIGSGSAVTQKKYTSNPKEYGEQYSIKDIKVVIEENRIFYTGMDANSTNPRRQLYKSTDGKSFIASDDTRDLGEHRYKSYIKITFNSANANIYLHQGMSGPLKKGVTVIQKGEYVAEYEGNLIKKQ